ncbi:unnamed protein product [Urochloa decumbens]|uniref:Uncharacterized protein n=1 Tax=Urochloa decumbens TaxID=240449 RepID=A0ABC9FAM2_9POAL
MSNVVGPDFPKLVPFGACREYLTWSWNVRDYLAQKNLIGTIFPGTECSDQQKAQALQYMRRHLNEDFKNEYNLEFDPLVLWQSLKDHFDRMKPIELPRAKFDWQQLHFSDFDSVIAYDSVLRRRVSQLKICGQEVTDEEMIEKTLSTFPPSQHLLHRSLRAANFHSYSKLIYMLLEFEKDDPELMRNHHANPTQRVASKRKRRRSRRRRSN